MDVKQAIEQRRSVRKFMELPVEEEKIIGLLEAARLAPTGSNTQSGRFIVIKGKEMRDEVAQMSHNQMWMAKAPLFIACVADIRARIPEGELYVDELSTLHEVKQCIRDVAIQAEHIVLRAEELGLSTCWIGWYTQEEIRKVLGIPQDKYVVGILVIGYGDESPSPRPRKLLEQIVRYEQWDGQDTRALTTAIRDFLLDRGADLVGFADLSDVSAQGYPSGISIGIKLPKHIVEGIYEGPTGAYYEAYKSINARLNTIVSDGAEFLIQRGYKAQAQTTAMVVQEPENRTSLPHKTVAIRAGLGWIGKSNVLVTPEYGGAVRLSTILTDAPIKAAAGISPSLCGKCEICKQVCPAQAIKGTAWKPGTDRDDMFDMRSCESMAMRLSGENFGEPDATICGRCFAKCPFTQRYLNADKNEE